MFALSPWFSLFSILAVVSSGFAQGVNLSDAAKPGDSFRYTIDLNVVGQMKVERDGKPDALPLKAQAQHTFVERVETPDAKGGVGKVVRFYETAKSRSEVGTDRAEKELPVDRKLIVAQRADAGPLHFSPAGPLAREDLELVAEHFDTLCLAGLLPGKDVKLGETWNVGNEATQHACQFEGLIKANLTGKLIEVKEGIAQFTITGTAEGIETGAHANLTISAIGLFDGTTKRIVELKWEQTDVREQGPASPATEVKATLTLKRTVLTEEPKELNDAVRAKLPAEGKIPDLLLQLRYVDSEGRYSFLYPRDWHIVGRTKDHLVMRLLDNGEFTAQATITAMKKSDPGLHVTPAEFKKLVAQLQGWEPDGPGEEGPQPTDAGRWLYRLSMKGKQDGLAVVQSFFLLAGPQGDQVAVSVLVRTEKVEKLGIRDLSLTNGIEFPAKK